MRPPREPFELLIDEGPLGEGHPAPKRVGILSLISRDCDGVPAMAEKARRFHEEAAKTLKSLGFTTIRPNLPTRTPEEGFAHLGALDREGCEAIVLYVADWTYSTTAAWAARLRQGPPLILWTNARPDCAGLIGAGVTKGALAELGLEPPFVYGDFDDPRARAELKTLCAGLAAAHRLKGTRYGLGGTRSLEMLTASIDPNQWIAQFGVDVDGFDELDVVDRSGAVESEIVAKHKRWIHETFGRVDVDDVVVDTSVRLYIALKEVIEEKRFDFVSVKCLPVMAKVATSFCLSHALLADGSDADGPKGRVVCACEADSNGALTMQMMKNVDDQAILFADVRWLDPDQGVLRLSNCGSHPTEHASSRKEVHWVKHGLQEMPWRHGGMCPQFTGREGPVTLARLSRVSGRYHMLVAGGEALRKDRDDLASTYWDFSPHTWVRLRGPWPCFTDALRSNHIHLMYGDFREELVVLCKALGVTAVTVD